MPQTIIKTIVCPNPDGSIQFHEIIPAMTQIINENEGKYSIVLPKTHLTQIPEEEAKKHLEIVSNLVEKKIEKHQTSELTELIVKQYKEEEKWINYLLDFEI